MDEYLKYLVDRDTPMQVKWDKFTRICPICRHRSYYCHTNNEIGIKPKQPDNFCCKCGQRFVIE